MAKNVKWHDDYWLLLLQIYLRQPVGLKPVYCREMVALALELHIHPKTLATKMQQFTTLDTPRIERFWNTYHDNPRKLSRAVRLLREMKGFGRADEFYDGVELNETWELDWQPIPDAENLTPVMLILVLNLYFQLTPATMVKKTPEVLELSNLLKLPVANVVELLNVYQHCDPYLNRRDIIISPLLQPCQQMWQRYANGDSEELTALADQLKEYFR